MKTQSLEKSLKPAFVIRVHLTDGSVESFTQTDATEAQKLWDKIEPSRLFTQSRLVIAGEHSKSVFVTAQVLRVDFIQDTNECWQFPGGYSDVVELSEEDFKKNAHLDEPELMAAREQPTPVGDLLVSFLKLHITGAKPLYLMIEFPVKLPAENQAFMQFMLSKSGLHMRLCGGGIGVITSPTWRATPFIPGWRKFPPTAGLPNRIRKQHNLRVDAHRYGQ